MSTFKEDDAQAAPANDCQKAMSAWRSEIDTLVTILCMGADRYAGYLAEGAPIPGAPRHKRTVTLSDGSALDIGIVDCAEISGRGASWRKSVRARAEVARDEIARQTGIPAAQWSAQAQTVTSDRRLVSWLVGQRLLPKPPSDLIAAESARRSEITADQRSQAADAIAARMDA